MNGTASDERYTASHVVCNVSRQQSDDDPGRCKSFMLKQVISLVTKHVMSIVHNCMMQFCEPAAGRASSCFDSSHLLQEQKRVLAKVETVAQGQIPGDPTVEGLMAWPWGTDDSCWLSQVEAAAAQVHLKEEASLLWYQTNIAQSATKLWRFCALHFCLS